MSITSIRLEPEMEEPLKNLSEKLGWSKNRLINQAVKEYIERHVMEDLRWADTLAALKSIQTGKTIPGDQVISWLQSWEADKELPKAE
ncbi:MAG: transcriptional regulator [Gammaproteobacteria bacterium]|nr:transcriptional regulator [Gammaproteobacteria bacterium]